MPAVTVPTVARTYRTAIRIGEEYVTLEEDITLPIDASDDDIAQAVALGMRIYAAQHDAIESQVAAIRADAAPGSPPAIAMRDPDAPASEKQRTYIATLQEKLGWSNDQLLTYASDQQVDLAILTKGQASTFIDALKQLVDTPAAAAPTTPAPTASPATPAAPREPPNTPAEARQRFFARYGARIGGTDWAAVQTFLRQPLRIEPSTIAGWKATAQAVRDRAA